ncbi:hypothetical protein A2230_07305 [candidate division WOR-1 bacterium RIFOXYA2_FULL_36_21]|uniref:Radical SAM core domain-containing protein n=1 Tax=candidate division WOR-1 bacterium RIFOXYB2_FULL_36_35 TaxID=1802578 RepID=A0A1F4S8Q0_UNCSA|nr:MAG: hypothetical protein A2230_07305 [candidate division WOR-1 bacterium RIFOXYA2_FULL_36_21]OGC16792.1 MAG: hypothetical protein A2290_07905 [candidate division WOR-1 bacterium RIFOXYB2_FULL_36_35]OGC19807.1 MAG: hypothetical protein A2282_01055 [candidate division WOR-1 bacterium RIFOXYA12_FULL_36_13]
MLEELIMKDKIERLLPSVRKPAQYIGNELNSIHKNWDSCSLKIAIGYPDLYEVGMSNLGVQILYHILNLQDKIVCERFFAPKVDMEQQLLQAEIPLFSLESWRPLKDFDMLGFSIGHELTYTNLVNILHLAKIPIYSKDRTEKDPLIFAGGPSVISNPVPVEDFIDFFLIGDGEEAILEIAEQILAPFKGKKERLERLSKIEGIYVPGIGNVTKRRIVKNLNTIPYPVKPIVPFIKTVHDRAVVEIMRGCGRGCKFCSAFCAYKPVRERSPEKVIELGRELLKNTGYDELSLISLSSSDYSQIEYVAKTLAKELEIKKINLALPSLRLDSMSVKLMKETQRVRPSSVTVAPEAGTQRLRDFINKSLSEEEILRGVKAAYSEGISKIKLYFMIGLPTETEEDLQGIVTLSKKISEIGRSFTKNAHVTAAVSTFIPKPHTPFERERQISIKETIEKQKFLKQYLRGKGLELRWHDAKTSVLEGVFSRGDKKLSDVIVEAWKLGARLDAWSENFNFETWERAFQNCGIDMNEYLNDTHKEMPWDKISL